MQCPRCGALTEWQRDGFEEGRQVMTAACTSCEWEEGDPVPCIDPSCAQTTGHTEDCALTMDGFREDPGQVEVK